MPIEFSCTGCQKLLRVSDESAGKDARCPDCGAIDRVPFASTPAAPPPSAPASNPFGAAGVNPYAPPQAASYQPDYGKYATGPIQPTVVGVEPILNYAWQIWQENLGLLVGVYVVILGISIAIGIPLGIAQGALEANNNPELAAVIALVGNIFSNVVQIYLSIGMIQIALKLARRQRAEFTELFNGGSRFLPVLGVSILLGLAITVGTFLCIVPGIILALMLWPSYYLVVDDKSPVIESFSRAAEITKGNWGTGFLLFLLAFVIGLAGILALCIGIIFAAPLVVMLWVTAYLMMSGQLSPYPNSQQPAYGKP